jgi:ketosteroid isomerase-like protein
MPAVVRLFVMCGMIAMPVRVFADLHFDADRKNLIVAEEQQLAGEIEAFLEAYAEAYNNQDYRVLKTMWHDDGNPVYMAEEVPFPLYGQSRLDNYFNPVPGKRILEGIDNRYSEVRAKYVAPGVAVATYRLDWDIKLTGMPAVAGWDRVMAVFVETGDLWKLSAYAEAPMGAASMVRKKMKAHPAQTDAQKAAYATTLETIKTLSEAGVSEGFADFLADRKDLDPTY